MGFLAGALSPLLTAATQAAGGIQEGKVTAIREGIARRRQASQDALADALKIKTMQNLDSEMHARDNPKETPVFSQDGVPFVMTGGSMHEVPVDSPQPSPVTSSGPASDNPSSASPTQGVQGGQAAPSKQAPKFGTRAPNPATIPGTPENLAATKAQSIIKAKASNEFGYHPPQAGPTNVYLPSVNKDTGETEYTVVPNKGPVSPKSTGLVKPQAGGKGGGVGSLSPQSVQAMYDQAQHADAVMRKYEDDYRKGKVSVNAGSQTLGSGAGAHSTGIGAILSGAEAAGSNALLGLTDKRYQEYLTAQKRFGNIMGNLMSKRYSEYQGTLDTQLAGLSTQDAMPTLDLKQSYRSDLLKNRPASQGASPVNSTPTGKPKLTQAGYQNGRAKGLTDAQLEQHYDLSGVARQ